MRNIIGSPAEGDDFFDRPKILERLRRELDNLANILIVAPRRVGKNVAGNTTLSKLEVRSKAKGRFPQCRGEER